MATWEGELAALRADYVRGLATRLREIDELLLRLEREPGDGAAAGELLRRFHGLAGSGATYGYPRVTALGNEGEARCAGLLERGAPFGRPDLAHCRALAVAIQAAVQAAVEVAVAADPGGEPAPTSALAPPSPEASDVLVVEEDEEAGRALCRRLEQEGLSPRSARTRAEACRELDRRLPDALIAAASLPDGSGYGLADHLRDSPGGELPAVLLLGPRGGILDKAEALHCGADGYFEKPVDAEALMRRLQHLLSSRRAEPARILCMEDDREQAAYARAILEPAGYEVRCCERAAEFERELALFRPDLVLMDILLPGLSGYDLVRWLRQDERHATLPVLFLTTQGQLQARIETARAGGDAHLEKPVPAPLLLSAVAAQVERSRFVRNLLNQDGLTRLLTHTALLERARATVEELAREPRRRAVFVMIDVDHFKSVNDRFGHPVGDRVLAALAALLRRHLRQTDTLGRYGGEEYAVVLDGLDRNDAGRVIERIRRQFEESVHAAADGTGFSVTFSAGIAEIAPGMGLEAWREAADQALYAAKAKGRNRVELAPSVRAWSRPRRRPPAAGRPEGSSEVVRVGPRARSAAG